MTCKRRSCIRTCVQNADRTENRIKRVLAWTPFSFTQASGKNPPVSCCRCESEVLTLERYPVKWVRLMQKSPIWFKGRPFACRTWTHQKGYVFLCKGKSSWVGPHAHFGNRVCLMRRTTSEWGLICSLGWFMPGTNQFRPCIPRCIQANYHRNFPQKVLKTSWVRFKKIILIIWCSGSKNGNWPKQVSCHFTGGTEVEIHLRN